MVVWINPAHAVCQHRDVHLPQMCADCELVVQYDPQNIVQNIVIVAEKVLARLYLKREKQMAERKNLIECVCTSGW